MKKNIIQVKNLCKEYDGELIVDHIDFEVGEREFLTHWAPAAAEKRTIRSV